jgi:hypothetical protein
METLTHPEIEIDDRKSMESWQIESQLAEIGVPYIEVSWTDEYLIHDNLRNYFAEVIAKFSHIEIRTDTENQLLKDRQLKWIQLRRKYAFFDLAESQQLVIDLMGENKYLTTLL